MAFGCALLERIVTATDLGAALVRQLPGECRYVSGTVRDYHRHASAFLREAGVDGGHDMLAHAVWKPGARVLA